MNFFLITSTSRLKIFACLILGSLLGAVFTNVMIGFQIDRLVFENRHLALQLEEEKLRLKQLEKKYHATPVVQKIVLTLHTDEDKHTRQELEHQIKNLLVDLVGLRINQLDPTILRDILHNRILSVGEDTFLLFLETIIVDDELTFVAQVKKRPRKTVDDL